MRKLPAVIELFSNHGGGKMAKRKVETKRRNTEIGVQKKKGGNKVACDYDGVDLGAHMDEDQILSEHQSANRNIEKKGGRKMDSEEEAARVIQAAQVRKKLKKKRDTKKKEEDDSQEGAARVIQAAQIRKKNKKKRDAKKKGEVIDAALF